MGSQSIFMPIAHRKYYTRVPFFSIAPSNGDFGQFLYAKQSVAQQKSIVLGPARHINRTPFGHFQRLCRLIIMPNVVLQMMKMVRRSSEYIHMWIYVYICGSHVVLNRNRWHLKRREHLIWLFVSCVSYVWSLFIISWCFSQTPPPPKPPVVVCLHKINVS